MRTLKQSWQAPSAPKPIAIIGAGGIVRDAHLPAYRKAGFTVAGLYDLDETRSQALAKSFDVGTVYPTLEAAVACGSDVVYDLALPPSAITGVLSSLPDGASVLIQKPMGANLDEARAIQEICVSKRLKSAMNFQLRFSPMMLAVRDIISQGLVGELIDIDIHLSINTPWAMFPFLQSMSRVEIAVHSIHYLDLVRSLVGEPNSVFARTMADPRSPGFAQTRTSAILDYGDRLRCTLSINHNHPAQRRFQDCSFRFEGTDGAIMASIGVLMNYPHGEPDELWLTTETSDWEQIPLEGGWFPDAFIGTMSNVQRFAAGEDTELWTTTGDCIHTMALVEACFESSRTPGTTIPTAYQER